MSNLVYYNLGLIFIVLAIISTGRGNKVIAEAEITVHSESIQTPSLFSHVVIFSLISLHSIPHIGKAKTGFYKVLQIY